MNNILLDDFLFLSNIKNFKENLIEIDKIFLEKYKNEILKTVQKKGTDIEIYNTLILFEYFDVEIKTDQELLDILNKFNNNSYNEEELIKEEFLYTVLNIAFEKDDIKASKRILNKFNKNNNRYLKLKQSISFTLEELENLLTLFENYNLEYKEKKIPLKKLLFNNSIFPVTINDELFYDKLLDNDNIFKFFLKTNIKLLLKNIDKLNLKQILLLLNNNNILKIEKFNDNKYCIKLKKDISEEDVFIKKRNFTKEEYQEISERILNEIKNSNSGGHYIEPLINFVNLEIIDKNFYIELIEKIQEKGFISKTEYFTFLLSIKNYNKTLSLKEITKYLDKNTNNIFNMLSLEIINKLLKNSYCKNIEFIIQNYKELVLKFNDEIINYYIIKTNIPFDKRMKIAKKFNIDKYRLYTFKELREEFNDNIEDIFENTNLELLKDINIKELLYKRENLKILNNKLIHTFLNTSIFNNISYKDIIDIINNYDSMINSNYLETLILNVNEEEKNNYNHIVKFYKVIKNNSNLQKTLLSSINKNAIKKMIVDNNNYNDIFWNYVIKKIEYYELDNKYIENEIFNENEIYKKLNLINVIENLKLSNNKFNKVIEYIFENKDIFTIQKSLNLLEKNKNYKISEENKKVIFNYMLNNNISVFNYPYLYHYTFDKNYNFQDNHEKFKNIIPLLIDNSKIDVLKIKKLSMEYIKDNIAYSEDFFTLIKKFINKNVITFKEFIEIIDKLPNNNFINYSKYDFINKIILKLDDNIENNYKIMFKYINENYYKNLIFSSTREELGYTNTHFKNFYLKFENNENNYEFLKNSFINFTELSFNNKNNQFIFNFGKLDNKKYKIVDKLTKFLVKEKPNYLLTNFYSKNEEFNINFLKLKIKNLIHVIKKFEKSNIIFLYDKIFTNKELEYLKKIKKLKIFKNNIKQNNIFNIESTELIEILQDIDNKLIDNLKEEEKVLDVFLTSKKCNINNIIPFYKDKLKKLANNKELDYNNYIDTQLLKFLPIEKQIDIATSKDNIYAIVIKFLDIKLIMEHLLEDIKITENILINERILNANSINNNIKLHELFNIPQIIVNEFSNLNSFTYNSILIKAFYKKENEIIEIIKKIDFNNLPFNKINQIIKNLAPLQNNNINNVLTKMLYSKVNDINKFIEIFSISRYPNSIEFYKYIKENKKEYFFINETKYKIIENMFYVSSYLNDIYFIKKDKESINIDNLKSLKLNSIINKLNNPDILLIKKDEQIEKLLYELIFPENYFKYLEEYEYLLNNNIKDEKINEELKKIEKKLYKDINIKIEIFLLCAKLKNKLSVDDFNFNLYDKLISIYNKDRKLFTKDDYFEVYKNFYSEQLLKMLQFYFKKDIKNNILPKLLSTYDRLVNFNINKYYKTKRYYYKNYNELFDETHLTVEENKEVLEYLMYLYEYNIGKINNFINNFYLTGNEEKDKELLKDKKTLFNNFNILHLVNFDIVLKNNKEFLENNFLNIYKVIKKEFNNDYNIINIFFDKYLQLTEFPDNYILSNKDIIDLTNKALLLETNINDIEMLKSLKYGLRSGVNNESSNKILNLTIKAENNAKTIIENLEKNKEEEYDYPMPFVIEKPEKVKNDYYMYMVVPAFDKLIYSLGYATNSCMTLDGVSADILLNASENEKHWNSYIGFKLNPKYKQINIEEKNLMKTEFKKLNNLIEEYNKELLENDNKLKFNESLNEKRNRIKEIVMKYFIINSFAITWIKGNQAVYDNFQGNNNDDTETDNINYHVKKLYENAKISNQYNYIQILKKLIEYKKEKKNFDKIILQDRPLFVNLGKGYTNSVLFDKIEKQSNKEFNGKFDYFKEFKEDIYTDASKQVLVCVHEKYNLKEPTDIIKHFEKIYNKSIKDIEKLIDIEEKNLFKLIDNNKNDKKKDVNIDR